MPCRLHPSFVLLLFLFHWNGSDEMMMIALENATAQKGVEHAKVRLDVEIPRKKEPNCKVLLLLSIK